MPPRLPESGLGADWSECAGMHLAIGAPIRTACGEAVLYSAATPCVFFRHQTVYFCLPICRQGFEIDPLSSCMAARLYSPDE